MSAQILKLLTLRGWINLVMSTEACEMLGHESKDVRGLSQVSVNTSVMWLSGMGGMLPFILGGIAASFVWV